MFLKNPDSGVRPEVLWISFPHSAWMFTAAATVLHKTSCIQKWNCCSLQVSFQLLWNQSLKNPGCMHATCAAFPHSAHYTACPLHLHTAETDIKNKSKSRKM